MDNQTTTTEHDYIEREGPIFECGDYPHQKFSMTPEEMQAAVAEFKPVDLELEHYDSNGTPNILSGKLGKLVATRVAEDGKTMLGKSQIPRWLHDLFAGQPIPVSAVFRHDNKRLERAGLVLKPQVSHAALFSAYAATFAGQRHSAKDLEDIQNLHDIAVRQGAACSPKEAAFVAPQKEKRMGLLDEIKALFTQHNIPVEDGESAPVQPVPPPVAPQADPVMAAQFSQAVADLERIKKERREESAKAIADKFQREGKITPAAYNTTVALFTRAMEDDERDPSLVTFSGVDGSPVQASRADVLKAEYEARLGHGLLGPEQIASNQAVFALGSGGGTNTDEAKEKRTKELAEMTPMGKAALNGNGGNN